MGSTHPPYNVRTFATCVILVAIAAVAAPSGEPAFERRVEQARSFEPISHCSTGAYVAEACARVRRRSS